MTDYTVRIELHDADEDDYDRLHKLMEKKGFVRWVESRSGARKKLPTAEYNLPGTTLKRSEVLDRAKEAAANVKPKPKPWVLVTESAGRTWSGLPAWDD